MTVPGDDQHDAFLRLFMAHEPAVRAFVRAMVPMLADANDVMQEVAVVLWRKFPEYDASRDFRGWAFGIAKMKVLAWQRDRGRDRHVFGAELTELLAGHAELHSDRLEAQREALRRCLQKLPEPQRRMVDSAYAPGARMAELAAVFGQTVAAFYKGLHRVRLLLVDCARKELSKEGWV